MRTVQIWKARECLTLFLNIKVVQSVADIIEALTIRLPNLGVTLLPAQFKRIRNPLEIINMVISSQTRAYLNVEELIEVATLLGLGSPDDIAIVEEAIAREAALSGDLQLASNLCLGSKIISLPINSLEDIVNLRNASEPINNVQVYIDNLKSILSGVAECSTEGGWDSLPKENKKLSSFAALELPWLLGLSNKEEYSKKEILGANAPPGKHSISVKFQSMINNHNWLAGNDIAPRDELLISLAKSIMISPVTKEDDILGCVLLLNMFDVFNGVEVIEE